MFRLVDRPFIMPGRTLIGSTEGPVVDTEVILGNGGRVYLSRQEIREAVKLVPDVAEALLADLGWLSPAGAAELRAAAGRLEEQLDEALAGQPKVVSLDDARALIGVATVA